MYSERMGGKNVHLNFYIQSEHFNLSDGFYLYLFSFVLFFIRSWLDGHYVSTPHFVHFFPLGLCDSLVFHFVILVRCVLIFDIVHCARMVCVFSVVVIAKNRFLHISVALCDSLTVDRHKICLCVCVCVCFCHSMIMTLLNSFV